MWRGIANWFKANWQTLLTTLVSILLAGGGVGAGIGLGHHWYYTPTPPAPVVTAPPLVTGGPNRLLEIPATHNGQELTWDTHYADCDSFEIPGRGIVVLYPKAGTYHVSARTASGGRIACAHTRVVVAGPIPPDPPTPPVPPTPPPGPAPIPADGLHVLFVIDSQKTTVAQAAALSSQAIRAYLSATCPKGPDGKTAEWRMLFVGDDVSHESKLWQDAFARTQGKTAPWVIVSNPQKGGGFEGALPADANGIMALLKQFGG